MKIERKPSDHEVLAGLVERVTYHNAENGFCVLRAKARGHRVHFPTTDGRILILSRYTELNPDQKLLV